MCPNVERVVTEVIGKYFDPQVLAVVYGGIPETTALMKDPLPWDMIFFTGSERVARIIGPLAAATLSPFTLELGGKSPCIICQDHGDVSTMCDRIVWGKTINAGQTCIAPDYMLVHEDQVNDVMYGTTVDDIKNNSTFSRNVSEIHTERLVTLINEALASSPDAQLVVGGSAHADISKRFFPPTIIVNPAKTCKILTEEIFGCVMPVITYKTEHEAVKFVQSMKGTPLALYVYTTQSSTYERFLTAIPSGGSVQNDTLVHFITIGLPFGGVGTSGSGKGHSRHSFKTFTHERAVLRSPCYKIFDYGGIRYPPYTKWGGYRGKIFEFFIAHGPYVPPHLISLLLKVALMILILVGLIINWVEAWEGLNENGWVQMKTIVLGGTGGLFEDIGEWLKDL
jgi:acyl-CoA reductase-like NAD-dependent aldehyde dehydrogenase